MTVRLLSKGVTYHTEILADGSTREHVHSGAVRDAGDCYVLDCAECDALTWVSKATDSENLREIEAAIKDGHPVKPCDPDRSKHDALVFAKEDGSKYLATTTIPTDSDGRRVLTAALRLTRAE